MSAYHASRVDALRAELAQLIERVSAGATEGDAGALAHVAVLAADIERELDALAVALFELPARAVVGDACARCKGAPPLVLCACSWRVEGQAGYYRHTAARGRARAFCASASVATAWGAWWPSSASMRRKAAGDGRHGQAL